MKRSKIATGLLLSILFFSLASCLMPRKTASRYYASHQTLLDSINRNFRKIYQAKPFSLEFTDRKFNYVSIEFITDSLKYIYEFEIEEPRMMDTLEKFGMDIPGIYKLMDQMKKAHCIWVNNLEYFVYGASRNLTYISTFPLAFSNPFGYQKYYILTYYSQPQYYDEEGRLLDGRSLRRLRKVNNEIFWRINDSVCYTISERFR